MSEAHAQFHIHDTSKWKKSLWAIERSDGRGFLSWHDHSRRQPGEAPEEYVLFFSTSEKAEKYNEEEIGNTGVVLPVTINAIEPFAEKCWSAGIHYCMINFDRDRQDNKPIRFDDLMAFLQGRRPGV